MRVQAAAQSALARFASDKACSYMSVTTTLRTLALDSNALKAAKGQPLVLTVADPEGNKLELWEPVDDPSP